jgi:cytochrome c-type biogenesis protein CcmH/NrfF
MAGGNSGTVHIEGDTERFIFGSLRCMCGTCARDLLSTCTCETAEEARQKIRQQLQAGEDRDQILAEYAASFGPDALAVPPNKGILKAIWIVPVAGIALGTFGLARLLRRWRGGVAPAPAAAGGASAGGAVDPYEARLDDELKDLDG